jgi:hypothetical protein
MLGSDEGLSLQSGFDVILIQGYQIPLSKKP